MLTLHRCTTYEHNYSNIILAWGHIYKIGAYVIQTGGKEHVINMLDRRHGSNYDIYEDVKKVWAAAMLDEWS